ncbi:MAG TPA: tetratricopeptide repeat protein [Longimicrobiales bacterium]
MFRLKLFGGISLEGPEGPVAGRAAQRHRLALLALLAVARQQGLSRDKVIGYLWPDAGAERARAQLSDSIYRINQALDGDAVSATGDVLRLNSQRVSCDAAEFLDAIDRGDFERAVQLQSAPLLDGFYLPEGDEFERWSEIERQRFKEAKVRALEALASQARDPASSVRWWRMLAAETPYSSRTALQLMQALERAGERAAAVQHAQTHARIVRAQLEVEPDEEVLAYAESLRRMPARASAIIPAAAPAHNAPAATEPVAIQPAPIDTRRRRAQPVLLATTLVIIALIALIALARRRDQPAALQPGTSIVVLPFADQSPRGDHEYFADGMTEELMVKLANTPGLKVMGRTTAFAFKGQTPEPRELAARLNVDAILTGSVRVAENRLRITAQLLDAESGFELWSETYDREQSDVLAVQEEIARSIVARLSGQVAQTPVTNVATSSTDDPEAYNLYLRGRFEWHKRTEQGLRAAADYFAQATLRAPQYARAYAGLGDAHAVMGFYDYLPPRNAFPQAKMAALRALQLDSSLAEAHATLGYVALYYEWQWPQAERAFKRSIELNPRYSTAHQWYANHLTAMGRFDEAVHEMRTAMDIDPLSLIANAALGWVFYYAGDYNAAIRQLDQTLQLNPSFELAHLWRGLALLELQRYAEATRSIERAVQLSGGSAISTALLAHAYARAGERDRARPMLAQLEAGRDARYTPSYEIAKVYHALGDQATALQWLRRAREERSHSIAFLLVDPQLRGLRAEAAFQELVRAVKLQGHVAER